MVSLDTSSNDFSQKHNFDHFHLILFKHLFRKISFSDFVYLLLDHITYVYLEPELTTAKNLEKYKKFMMKSNSGHDQVTHLVMYIQWMENSIAYYNLTTQSPQSQFAARRNRPLFVCPSLNTIQEQITVPLKQKTATIMAITQTTITTMLTMTAILVITMTITNNDNNTNNDDDHSLLQYKPWSRKSGNNASRPIVSYQLHWSKCGMEEIFLKVPQNTSKCNWSFTILCGLINSIVRRV